MKPYIYIRTLKHAEHTVFCVQEGQKAYFDPLFNRMVPYSSGQQIKRCILTTLTDDLNVPMAPITFNYNITKKDGLENKETWAPCDPRYIDQLIGGWMRAGKDMVALKRRSPLSVSAMRPIHPLLGGLERDKENITFDRSDRPEWHPVNVRIEGSDRLMTKEEIEAYLQNNNRTLTKRIWIPDNTRATGLFVNLVVIVDNNGLQIDGRIEDVNSPYPIDKKFEAFNFHVINVADGNDMDQLRAAFDEAKATKGMPTAIIMKTVKGKGVSFMENQAGWHGKAPNDEQYAQAMADLEKVGEALCQK